MDDPMAFLESLWSGINVEELKCAHCDQPIGPDAVLARTFTLESSKQLASNERYAKRVAVPTLSEVIVLYHRHMECLFKYTRFVTISHLWHPHVAKLQYDKTDSEAHIGDVARVVSEDPVRICLGIRTGLKVNYAYEIWHDYISVPQWHPTLKSKIIQAIPKIYSRAELTVAYLSDVDPQNVKAMKEGSSIEERCRAISNICTAKWFSRVWTAMEFTQSRELRVMFKNYSLVDGFDILPPVVHELGRAWQAEVAKQGSAHQTEQMVGMGNNLVPWQLGPLESVRSQNMKGVQTTFANAHELLARRCVTIPRDFFHALLGILKLKITEPELSTDTKEALLQVARACMAEGDFSPLFMIPGSAQAEPGPEALRSHGYLDLLTFAMGDQTSPPTFSDMRFRSGNPIIQAEEIGTVGSTRRIDPTRGMFPPFTMLARLALESTGIDVDAFVKTIGGRLYGQDPAKIFRRLKEGNRMRELADLLKQLYDSFPESSDDITKRVAEIMGLSNSSGNNPLTGGLSPLHHLQTHGGTLHLAARGVVATVNCSKCHRDFLIRVGLLKAPSQVLGVKAYRVPGMKYGFTHKGGAGFLLNDGHIVGRILWGTPTCDCEKLGEVEVALDDLPLPRPNYTKYGEQTGKKWYPVALADQIKW
jgi:hypothetical protein